MPSPFPGMDPYLEAHWRDIHARLIIYASDSLQSVLPPSLRARVEEQIVLESPMRLEIRILALERRPEARAAVAEPILVDLDNEPATETYIEIIDSERGNRVVTVIEFLSPSSKMPGPNRVQYQRMQREICASDTNLVEIDLNRPGVHTLAFPLGNLRSERRTGYMVCVRRSTHRDKAEVYPMPLWARLPIIKIPLRPDDADVPLDLQKLVEQCYRNGGYEGTLNYSVDPDPPLLGAEKDWAEQFFVEKGLRPSRKPTRRKGKPKSR